MKVAIVYWGIQNKDLRDLASALSQGVETQGHQVQVFDGLKDDLRLTPFNYIIMGTVPQSLFNKKLSSKVLNGIKRSGTLTGKKSFAFVKKNGFRSFKVLHALMTAMESEGMLVKNFEIFTKTDEARILGAKLHI